MAKKLFIETLGCAMNVRDSEHMIAELGEKEAYELTDNSAEADLIIINTCSVREKPVHKLFSELGAFNIKKKAGAKIGVAGCTASHLGDEIIKRAPYVNFVLGARNVSKISDVIHRDKAVETAIDYDESQYAFKDFRSSPYKSFINISIGCDKQCTFCIVPHTRGEEISIPADLIVEEVRKSVVRGAYEVFLLGQNVNNYGRRFSGEHEKINFTTLLRRISAVEGLERIRFTSPHPLHMDDAFLEEFASNPKICKSMHMPLQSGSTQLLKAMKRGYSKEWFLNRAKKLREMAPSASISTDVIIGFPGESESDYLDTLEVLGEVQFEQMFSFKYSARPHTEAATYTNVVDAELASRRLAHLQAFHNTLLDRFSYRQMGSEHVVYFEELKPDGYVTGRSDNNLLIKVKGSEALLGTLKKVRIIKVSRLSYEAELLE